MRALFNSIYLTMSHKCKIQTDLLHMSVTQLHILFPLSIQFLYRHLSIYLFPKAEQKTWNKMQKDHIGNRTKPGGNVWHVCLCFRSDTGSPSSRV